MKTAAEIRRLLSRLLASGPMERLPKKREECDMVLALGAARLEPGRPYDEREINELLTAWLEGFASPFGVDHVTVRRALVDGGFLTRDAAGSTYTAALDRIGAVLPAEARSIDPALVRSELDRTRAQRKQAHESRKRT